MDKEITIEDVLKRYETYVKHSDVPIFLKDNVIAAMTEWASIKQIECCGWVKASKRKPEEGKWVLLNNGYWTGVGRYKPDHEDDDVDLKAPAWQDETTEYISPTPIYWMPLPNKPI